MPTLCARAEPWTCDLKACCQLIVNLPATKKPEGPLPVIDIICLIDGSDSFNIKVDGGNTSRTDKNNANSFPETLDRLQKYLFPQLQRVLGSSRLTYSIVQFSGVKQLEGKYKPGNDGDCGSAGLKHWNLEYGPSTELPPSSIKDIISLDGNGQFYLCLQDLALGNLSVKAEKARSTMKGESRRKVVIAIMDEEWDCNKLQDVNGNSTNPEAVCDLAHKNGLDIFSIILRPNYLKNMNEDFIENKLCRDAKRYLKVYSENFDKDMEKAMDSVISQIGAMRDPLSQ